MDPDQNKNQDRSSFVDPDADIITEEELAMVNLDEPYEFLEEEEDCEDTERVYREQLKEKMDKMKEDHAEKRKEEEEETCRIKDDTVPEDRKSREESREFGSFGNASWYSSDYTGSSFSSDSSEWPENGAASYMEMFTQSLNGRTLSEVFREKYGDNATDRVYGFTTESLDYLKDHPDLQIPGPSPVRIPHDELMNALTGFSNMYLAHEIAIDEKFRLERYTPEQNSMEARVHTQMKKAFWDIFEENLMSDPPIYNQALAVFEEIKKSLLDLLLPHNHNMRKRINETLDVDLIRQQVEQDCFDAEEFQKYAIFIVNTLGQLCCPSRDPDIEELRNTKGVTKIFRGILAVIDKMKLDMANFYIQQFRPSITRHVVQYERVKFADFLELEYFLKEDGLRVTKNWLMRHKIGKRDTATIMSKAFGELLVYDMKFGWPETLTLDLTRFNALAQELQRLGIIGAILLTSGSLIQIMYGVMRTEFRDTFKKQLKILITEEEAKDPERLKSCIQRVADQSIFLVNEFVKKEVKRPMNDAEKAAIRNCVEDVASRDHKIRTLLVRRVIDYAEEICLAEYGNHVTMPAGLSCIQFEAAQAIGQFQRIVRHNRGIYDDMYFEILDSMNTSPKYPDVPGSTEIVDMPLLELLMTLREPVMDEALEDRMIADKRRRADKVRRLALARKYQADLAARRRAEDPTQALVDDEAEAAKKKEAEKAVAVVKLDKLDPTKFTQVSELPIRMICKPDCSGAPPCASQISNTTQDTICTAAIAIPEGPVKESFMGKRWAKMTIAERRGRHDHNQFKTFCCAGEAQVRRQRMLSKLKLKTKPKIPCGPHGKVLKAKQPPLSLPPPQMTPQTQNEKVLWGRELDLGFGYMGSTVDKEPEPEPTPEPVVEPTYVDLKQPSFDRKLSEQSNKSGQSHLSEVATMSRAMGSMTLEKGIAGLLSDDPQPPGFDKEGRFVGTGSDRQSFGSAK